jgi:hypothetical protein
VRAVDGKDHPEQVSFDELAGASRRLTARALLVLIGAIPTPTGRPTESLDPDGFVLTGPAFVPACATGNLGRQDHRVPASQQSH